MTDPSSLRVLVRVDAGPDIGVGHAMRCSTLAAALRRRGHRVSVVAESMVPFVRERFERVGVDVIDLRHGDVIESIHDLNPDVCLVDGYLLGDAVESISATGLPLMVIDDNHELAVEKAGLVLNQNLHAADVDYPTDVATTYLLGADYALIRDDVVGLDRSQAGTGDVLVSFGGSDPKRLTVAVATMLVERGAGAVTVALGPTHEDFGALSALIDGSGGVVQLADPHLTDALGRTDVAVIGGGSTLWEVAHLGIPSVAAIVADNQADGSAAAAAAGFVQVVDCRTEPHEVGADRCVTAALRLLNDSDEAEQLARSGRAMFDGRGPDRVVDAIEGLVLRSSPV